MGGVTTMDEADPMPVLPDGTDDGGSGRVAVTEEAAPGPENTGDGGVATTDGATPNWTPLTLVTQVMATAPLLQNDALPQATAGAAVMLELGVLHEGFNPDSRISKGDQRISMVPDVAEQLIKDGYGVIVEKGAGIYSGFTDEAGASWPAEVHLLAMYSAPAFVKARGVLKKRKAVTRASPKEIPIASYEKAPLWMDLNWRDLHAQRNRCDQWRRVSEGMQEVHLGALSKRSRGELLIILTTGCKIASRAGVIQKSTVLFSIEPPTADFPQCKGKVIISWVGRLLDKGKDICEKAKAAGVTLIDVTAVPRITIAQKLDVLSSQAKVAGSDDKEAADQLQGHRAVIEASYSFGRFHTAEMTAAGKYPPSQTFVLGCGVAGLAAIGHRAVIEASYSFGRFHTAEMTAAGKYPPSQTFVLGCGVAGLAAIGTSKAMGSVVRAWDVRDVSDQVHSMGAKWVSVDFKESGEGQGGYAKESSDAFKKVQQETFKKVLSECDIAISTAAIPGRPSPLLITKDAVSAMRPGSRKPNAAFLLATQMPTPLGPCGPAGAATSWDWHRESALVAKDPGASHLGRASSVYTAWCQMKELCTVKTSEVFDASSSAFAFFFPPLPEEPDVTLAGDAPKEARDQLPDLRLATPLLEENLRGYGSMPGIPMSFTLSDYCAREPPFSPASTVSYGRQAPVSPAATEYCYGGQAPVSPASTHYFYATDAPDSPASTTYIFGREAPSSPASTVCDYQTFEAPLPEYNGGEALTEVLSPKKFPTHLKWRHFSEDRSQARNNFGEHCPSQWCGLFNSCCPDAVPESCSRCQQALGSFFDHHCPFLFLSLLTGTKVVVDLAAAGGGNCELTKPGEVYTTANGVTIIGYSDMPARMSNQASTMYAQNMCNLLRHIHGKEKAAAFMKNLLGALDAGEEGDIVSRSIVCSRDGQLARGSAAMIGAVVLTIGVGCMLAMGEGVKTSLLTTFLLAGAAGYQAVWGVAHALHTPLMSVTNAISGCTAIGGLLLLEKTDSGFAWLLAALAVLVSAVNIFGGFVVSQRMLDLFKKPGDKDFSGMMLFPGVVFLLVALTRPELLKAVTTVSALLCVAAIGGLATMSTANMGCKFGIVGVFGAMVATMVDLSEENLVVSSILLAIGAAAGTTLGMKVSPIALPQTVAAFHSLVGLAAMCTSIGSFVNRAFTDFFGPARFFPAMSDSPVKPLKVAVIGAGLGGLVLAKTILTEGPGNIEVQVYEAWDSWKTRGGSLQMAKGVRITMRTDLQSMLVDSMPPDTFKLGHKLSEIAENRDGVVLTFENGVTCTADLVVAADGIHSVVKRKIFNDDKPEHTGFRCLYALCSKPIRSDPSMMQINWYEVGDKGYQVVDWTAGSGESRHDGHSFVFRDDELVSERWDSTIVKEKMKDMTKDILSRHPTLAAAIENADICFDWGTDTHIL
ncbi:NAD(P) transhydrogenase, mitochondrial [Symbiodinium microadriaticum]|uniref:proton-translocating NAD(P)(+) transhydrogenase n=1 Tax=Symbiodinium microadriaticum TaxID=2951 RepID=A0A1Q9CDQ7_SYMMI|nr:NAD(P) transhydrogenase, mitochondrial [Symbiodinium microadriaticum]